MKHILLVMSLVIYAMPGAAGQKTGNETSAQIMQAKSAIKQLAGALQKELKASIHSGGPVAAIGVCNTRAMPISAQVATEHGIQISRVSLKNRNPVNAANEWQTAVLESFESQKSNGADITKLAWSETVDVDGGQEFRFMKAIPTGQVCLMCHGTGMAADVTDVITDLYPQDKATDYSEGDIRGAFVVTRKLEK